MKWGEVSAFNALEINNYIFSRKMPFWLIEVYLTKDKLAYVKSNNSCWIECCNCLDCNYNCRHCQLNIEKINI